MLNSEIGIFPVGRLGSLVSAACGHQPALPFWRDYLQRLGGREPNMGEVRLYPLVAERLGDNLQSPDHSELLIKARRNALFNSLRQVGFASLLTDQLSEESIPHCFSKGIALTARGYRRLGVRTMSDIDIHVPEAHMQAIIDFAERQGWQRQGTYSKSRSSSPRAFHAISYSNVDGMEVDVHWMPRTAFAWLPDLRVDYYKGARTVMWNRVAWRVPSDTWSLIETIAHGVAYNPVASLRWVADGLELLRVKDVSIDWAYLIGAARAAKLSRVFSLGLTTLKQCGAAVPSAVLAELESVPVSAVESLETSLKLRKTGAVGLFTIELLHYWLRRPGTRLSRVRQLPSYIRSDRYECATWAEFVGRVYTIARHGN